jgi:nucleoside phosphorylase
MVTGSSVVASTDIQTLFRDQHRKMVGIDMECYGLYYAADQHGGSPVKVVCIKSVSDLADRAKGDDFQAYCSHMSAMVGLETVRGYFRR